MRVAWTTVAVVSLSTVACSETPTSTDEVRRTVVPDEAEPHFAGTCGGVRIEGRVASHVNPRERIFLQFCDAGAVGFRVDDAGDLRFTPTAEWPEWIRVTLELSILEHFLIEAGVGDEVLFTRDRVLSGLDEDGIHVAPAKGFDCEWGLASGSFGSTERLPCTRIDVAVAASALRGADWLLLRWIDAYRQ